MSYMKMTKNYIYYSLHSTKAHSIYIYINSLHIKALHKREQLEVILPVVADEWKAATKRN